MQATTTFDQLQSVQKLQAHYNEQMTKTHLKTLLQDADRNAKLRSEANGVILDATHEKIDAQGMQLLEGVVAECQVFEKIDKMFAGEKINPTEGRSVLHTALRREASETLMVDGKNVVEDVHTVLKQIEAFSAKMRSEVLYSGKKLKNIVAIGIGGSFLGPEFVYEALRYEPTCKAASAGYNLKFLANVDPTDFFRALEGIDVEESLFIIVSKTFTTAETMLNARTCKNHIKEAYKAKVTDEAQWDAIFGSHLCAVSTNLKSTAEFGIKDENVFGFWEWVGGRFSVSSAVGVLPLSLFYGYDNVAQFLAGCKAMDTHFQTERNISKNIPLQLGLMGFYNSHICGHASRAILPYSQALLRFAAHIQQVDMESNGKTVTKDGVRYPDGVQAGPIIFGEPGTNGQHSFYQLMHQGRVIPAEFIGFAKSQTPIMMEGEVVTSHQELMCNYFAQPDALALGKDKETLSAAGVPENMLEHKFFSGDRPSLSFLFKDSLTAFNCGQLLAIYEHRVAVEGFIFDCNSFDQWGVELGKVLAKESRSVFASVVDGSKTADNCIPEGKFNEATATLLKSFIQNM